MPGDPIILAADRGGRIRSFVATLGRFPAEPKWAVIGGFAVNVMNDTSDILLPNEASERAAEVGR